MIPLTGVPVTSRYYDISPRLDPRTPAWPTDPPVEFEPFKSLAEGGSSNVTKLTLGTHAGSHVDAPRHFSDNGLSVDELPLDVLIGEVSVLEVAGEVIDRRALDVAGFRPRTERVLFKTSNSALWSGAGFQRGFVGIAASAADFLVAAGVKLVGIDYLSIEAEHSDGAPAHQRFLDNGIVVLESIDLSAVPPGEYELLCLPLRLAGLDGAPARVVLRA